MMMDAWITVLTWFVSAVWFFILDLLLGIIAPLLMPLLDALPSVAPGTPGGLSLSEHDFFRVQTREGRIVLVHDGTAA